MNKQETDKLTEQIKAIFDSTERNDPWEAIAEFILGRDTVNSLASQHYEPAPEQRDAYKLEAWEFEKRDLWKQAVIAGFEHNEADNIVQEFSNRFYK